MISVIGSEKRQVTVYRFAVSNTQTINNQVEYFREGEVMRFCVHGK